MGKAITGHLELLYPSQYVKAADLRGKDVTVVIDHAEWENLVMAGGKKDRKVVIHLRSVTGQKLGKRWVVGKTVLRQIAAATGTNDVGQWSEKRVTLFPTTCRGKEAREVECIRVRLKTGAPEELPAEMTEEPEPMPAFVDEAGGGAEGSA
jgi:hypothetical protein